MSDTVTVDPLEEGREAYARRAWPEAYRLLQEADREGRLEPGDLEALAKSAWWIGLATESIAAFERAYALHLERGNRSMAAMMALTLRREYGAKMAGSVAKAWLHRAEHLLEGEPEAVAHGYLEIAHRELDFDRGDFEGALAHLDRAQEIASRLDDADLPVWVAISRAEVLGTSGRLDEAFGLMEGAAAVAVGGELGPFTTGAVFCAVMSVCRETADYRRGTEWAEVSKRWCERQDISGFPGICRVHRAEFMRLTGAWADAASEAERASDELQRFHPAMAGEAFHELGEIRLRMGDLEGAEDAFSQAQALGSESQPGKALLLLARGRTDAAAASIKGSLEEITWNKLARARLLPAQAGIAKVLGDLPTAEAAAAELEVIAEEFETAAIGAAAAHTAGLASLLRGDAADAIERFREARRLWREIDAPYEAAISTVLLAEARSVAGESEAATLELEAARATFERLGATPDMARTDALLAGPATRSRSREVRTFMFTDIVGSTALVEAIGDEAWHDLLRWHDDALRRCFASSAGEEVHRTGDGFFVAFPDARSALECAVAIQRTLADHRRDHGFAPGVRVGIHSAEATRAAGDYEGAGVHAAARIAALAQGGEVLASVETLDTLGDALGDVVTGEPREVSLKGLAKPVLVVAVDWRSPA
ncbi:MAG TPA: adenylate/guanylate cyclase domain-containing protein [Actinomycetota bacterium]|nr:adenylate/guanylate cyclase domain-containing protein [Actinomycetota bacterium]